MMIVVMCNKLVVIVAASRRSGPIVIKLFHSQLDMKFILLINVKMATIVGILTFIGRINKTLECFKQEKIVTFQYFTFYEQLKFMRN